MIAVTRQWVEAQSWIGEQRAAVLEVLSERDRAELDLAAARSGVAALRAMLERALDTTTLLSAYEAVAMLTEMTKTLADTATIATARDIAVGNAAVTEALAGVQDGLLKRLASDEPVDDAIGRALIQHDKRLAHVAVLEHVVNRGCIHAFDVVEGNPSGIACRELVKGGYVSTDQFELVTCRGCMVAALGWTPPAAAGAARAPLTGPADLAAMAAEMSGTFVSRELVQRAVEVLGDENLVLRDAIGRASVLLREALGP